MIDIKLDKDINLTLKTVGVDKHLLIKFENTPEPIEPVDPIEPEPDPEPPIEPELPPIDRSAIRVYDEDLSESVIVSTPSLPVFPHGLSAAFDMEYLGSFRVEAGGESNSNYAVGALGLHRENNSIFLAGHDHHDAIAEFSLNIELSKSENIREIPKAEVLQSYVEILGFDPDGKQNDKINGMLVIDGQLFLNSEIWYDGSANNTDALLVLDPNNLQGSDKTQYNRVQGDAKAAGWIGEIPEDAQQLLGGKYLIGWASNYSINSRYSIGPTLYTFDPATLEDGLLPTTPKISFPFPSHKLTPRGNLNADTNPSAMWNVLSKCVYGFIVPNTKLYFCVGRSGGNHSGVGYKITRDDGRPCHGSCPFEINDTYNYFWLFDLEQVAIAENPWDVEPISYGKWSHPHDNGGANVKGATYNPLTQTLYVSLYGKGQIGQFDRPPLINAYKITAKES